MKNLRKEFVQQLQEFIEIAEKNGVWYSMDDQSLLGVIRHGGFVPWEEKIQVMMTEASYERFKRVAKSRVIDSSDNSEIKSLCGYFVADNKDIKTEQGFVEIRVLSPTTTDKIKKFRSPAYKMKNMLKTRKINTKTALNDLHDVRFEGYLPLESTKQNIKSSWIQSMSFDVVEKNFMGTKVKVMKEYKRTLEAWFGKDFMNAEVPKHVNEYRSPVATIKEGI